MRVCSSLKPENALAKDFWFLIIVTFVSDSQTLNGPISGLHLGDKHCGTMKIKYAD
jgi:hypothetical protein